MRECAQYLRIMIMMHIFPTSSRRATLTRGLSLVETVVGVALFLLVGVAIFTTYQRVFITAKAAQMRIVAGALATEQFEIIRNIPFAQVGTQTGIPYGVIPAVQTLTRSGMTFIATTTIRNIDQPFDGTAGGTPNDLSPADNKSIEIEISCISCQNFRPYRLFSFVAPKDLEGASTNGSLFVQVIDAAGQPVQGANVHIVNSSVVPALDFSDVTATSGMLQIIDAPPSVSSYEITVSKGGYSTQQTYGAPIANPDKPHATVAVQTVTQSTFIIDKLATLDFSSVTTACAPVSNIGVRMSGAKVIGTAPDVLKRDSFFSTGPGNISLSDVEWDTYTIVATSGAKDLAGVMPLSPLSILPGATQAIQLIMAPKDPPALLVTVKDAGTGLPISGSTVVIDDGVASTTLTTGRGFLRQTDWVGGSGQSDYLDTTRYATNDSGIDTLSVPGTVRLYDTLGTYAGTGELESSTFDTGSASNFYQFTFLPSAQDPDTGPDSVRFQIATGNATTSWTYLGPDGTAGTYYTPTATDIAAIHNGDRYLRYKMFLSTASSTLTPAVSDIAFTFTSACVPPGQVLFQGVPNGVYTVTVSKSGYTDYTGNVTINAGTPWQELSVTMAP